MYTYKLLLIPSKCEIKKRKAKQTTAVTVVWYLLLKKRLLFHGPFVHLRGIIHLNDWRNE